jgi:hypothetical protein
VCEREEVGSDCVDCPPRAPEFWDGLCTWAERWRNDCARCGDGACHEREAERCPQDCVGCGDAVCDAGERDRCPNDCPGCGNGVCESTEVYDFQEGYCPLDCLPCEANRPGCFNEGVITCAADGEVADYAPCGAGLICVAGGCVGEQRCGNGRCEPGEVDCPADCHL